MNRGSYQESGAIPLRRNRNRPRVLLLDVSPDNRGARLHFAGDERIRVAWVEYLARDAETIAGMEPHDAFQLGRAASV